MKCFKLSHCSPTFNNWACISLMTALRNRPSGSLLAHHTALLSSLIKRPLDVQEIICPLFELVSCDPRITKN